ncbi:hypothetical protein ACSCBZ_10015 [Streptomyces niveiscabiei]|uniref:hypothetical protein n=1 Tax=Streptomyces niveiscabiei TaxID=164115 RepID=UPI003EBE224F
MRLKQADGTTVHAGYCGNVHQAEDLVHFHAPLHTDPEPPLRTTSGQLAELFARPAALCDHAEVETYTWSDLPAPPTSPDGIAAELARAHEQLTGLGLEGPVLKGLGLEGPALKEPADNNPGPRIPTTRRSAHEEAPRRPRHRRSHPQPAAPHALGRRPR